MSDANKTVFISYAREDTAAARRVADALRSRGIEVWFDEIELRGGDTWDAKIRKQINACVLFVPIISQHTETRAKGYFRLEWKLAVEQTHLLAEGVPFITPVVIDDTREGRAVVPPEFLRVQWTRLPGALPTPQFVEQVKRLLDAPSVAPVSDRRSPPADTASAGQRPALPQTRTSPQVRRRVPATAWGAVVFVAALVVGALVWRRAPEPATVPTPNAGAETRPPAIETKGASTLAADKSAAADKSTVADKSIAVLPFENLSDDKQNTAFFSDGMHEDILTNLANIRELRVVSRTSVMEYRGTTKKIPQIARELGVAYILEGSVRRAGDKVRITGQLIRAATDEHLWAKNYDRDLTPKEMFDVQAALATEIAVALRAAISPETKKLLERRPTENLAAYDLYLKGRVTGNTNLAVLRTREKFLREAVALDPNFAAAWGELAVVHASQVFQNFDHTPARLALADVAMAQAVRLAPDDLETIRALGKYAYAGYRDFGRAAAQFEKIIRLQPNNADAFENLGLVQRRQGLWRESLASLQKAAALEGHVVNTNVASLCFAGRRWDEAIEGQRKVVARESDSLSRQIVLLYYIFRVTGSLKEADDWLVRLTPEQLATPRVLAVRKWRAEMAGDFAEWKRLDGLQPAYDEEERPRTAQVLDAAQVFASQHDTDGMRARLGSLPAETAAQLQLDPANARLWGELAGMEALLGQKSEALRDARKAVELLPEKLDAISGATLRRNLAMVYAWIGDKDHALAELTRLVRVPYGIVSVHALRADAAFAPLRGDPRFEALLADPKNHAPLF
jgi:TolB-like protein/Flp pilus assembly protein TadD